MSKKSSKLKKYQASDLGVEEQDGRYFLIIDGERVTNRFGIQIEHRAPELLRHMVGEFGGYTELKFSGTELVEPKIFGSFGMYTVQKEFIEKDTDDLTVRFSDCLFGDLILNRVAGPEQVIQLAHYQPAYDWVGDGIMALVGRALREYVIRSNDGIVEDVAPAGGDAENEPFVVNREVRAVILPAGQEVTLRPGQVGYITQALGGSFTVYLEGNLFRIAGEDADAIRQEVVRPPELPLVGDVEPARGDAENDARAERVAATIKARYRKLSVEERTVVMHLYAMSKSVLMPLAMVSGACNEGEYALGVMAGHAILGGVFSDVSAKDHKKAFDEIRDQARTGMDYIRYYRAG